MRPRLIATIAMIAMTLAAAACESGPQAHDPSLASAYEPVARNAALREHMATHVVPARDLELAVMHGRLADARDLAAQLAAREVSEPSWRGYHDDMRAAARAIQRAGDLGAASGELGRLGRACGACHQAVAKLPLFPAEPAPQESTLLIDQMARHQWAAVRLWEGVIGPSDRAWVEGARVLATTALDARQTVHEVPNVRVFELAEQLREQAGRAAELTEHDARAQLYSDIVATCTACHAIVRPHARERVSSVLSRDLIAR